jgi:hypothetical protein
MRNLAPYQNGNKLPILPYNLDYFKICEDVQVRTRSHRFIGTPHERELNGAGTVGSIADKAGESAGILHVVQNYVDEQRCCVRMVESNLGRYLARVAPVVVMVTFAAKK